ncbi:kinesin-like protein KIN-UB isoform X1 [Cinnamomum micranthum f. kanehirae]|uniref:Kinesin-like protein n=1 Tax=Cinnamomum micranthum f. kanehirae TaxID=337451 RepID=A0A443P9U5_9MAGN|nr:kinesin-like protein KIN-UB isoform X1 [Cinnamomum micranthum f. kanehirae]
MASGGSYRNGTPKAASSSSSSKAVERPLSLNPNNNKTSSSSTKPKPSPTPSSAALRRSSAASGPPAGKDDAGVLGRVRVAVRLRPRNAEELVADADFADCVELQPELKRLKLRKNNWDSDTYEFDEVLTEFASQKRVYEVVAKPVVESVLEGYNGTVMAYGQTGTGKTFTLGLLGEEDTASRGIMVRSMEDILANISPEMDSVSVSYLQLYMETLQDLLDPSNDNISIAEDPKTGDVSVPGATLVEVRDRHSFVELLRVGEAHRFAANTKLNTESSRSHALLMVHVRRSVKGRRDREVTSSSENGNASHLTRTLKPPTIRKSKLVMVDLAGSERIDKSGSEGHTIEEAKSINLSLSALGKCINALAENSAHVPFRDSKLTRLLRDSIGGTGRTSLVVTIGPSPRHRGETASTIMFGQRAMKVENMVKLKEEFDYKSLARRLDIQLDKLIAEHERQQKGFEDEVEKMRVEAQNRISDAERKYANALESERLKYQKDYMESIKKLEEQWMINQQKQGDHRTEVEPRDDCLDKTYSREGPVSSVSEEIAEIKKWLQNEIHLRKCAEAEVNNLKNQLAQWKWSEAPGNSEILELHKMLEDEARQKEELEGEIATLKNQLLQLSYEADETSRSLDRGGSGKVSAGLDSLMNQVRHSQLQDSGNGQKAPIAKLFEQVGLQKILSLLESEDVDVRIHAVKVVANLAAEEANQEKIVEAGGLASLLMLLRSTEDETICRVAAGAIANLAMNETNQELIMAQGGISLLSMTAADAEDPQTLRMVAGAIANLCGNDKLQAKLRAEGGIKALLGMVRCGHADVLAQVARGFANFAKCESRASTQGTKTGRSLLIDDGALPWIVQNANNEASTIRRHIELTLCHLAQHEANAKELISGGALWEMVRISRDCSREDIRTLAQRTLTSSPTFKAELRRLRVEC